MTTETVVLLDLTTTTAQLDQVIGMQQGSAELLGVVLGLGIVIVALMTVQIWIGLRRNV